MPFMHGRRRTRQLKKKRAEMRSWRAAGTGSWNYRAQGSWNKQPEGRREARAPIQRGVEWMARTGVTTRVRQAPASTSDVPRWGLGGGAAIDLANCYAHCFGRVWRSLGFSRAWCRCALELCSSLHAAAIPRPFKNPRNVRPQKLLAKSGDPSADGTQLTSGVFRDLRSRSSACRCLVRHYFRSGNTPRSGNTA